MFDCKFYLNESLIGDERRYALRTQRILFLETNGKCAKCGKTHNFDYENLDLYNQKSNLEIAHIYGLRNFVTIGKNNFFHVETVADLNKYKNLILLCHSCHHTYDYNPTYSDYCEILKIKKNISEKKNIEEFIYQQLFMLRDDIEELFRAFGHVQISNDFDVVYFENKLDKNKVSLANKMMQKSNLINYVLYINKYFEEYDPEMGIEILKSFSSIYQKMKVTLDSNQILKELSQNDIINNINVEPPLFNGLITYCIWKCEVLEKYVDSK